MAYQNNLNNLSQRAKEAMMDAASKNEDFSDGTYAGDFSVAGLLTTNTLRVNTAPEASVATASTHSVVININGTDYKVLLAEIA